jgi:hypothetical protein
VRCFFVYYALHQRDANERKIATFNHSKNSTKIFSIRNNEKRTKEIPESKKYHSDNIDDRLYGWMPLLLSAAEWQRG